MKVESWIRRARHWLRTRNRPEPAIPWVRDYMIAGLIISAVIIVAHFVLAAFGVEWP